MPEYVKVYKQTVALQRVGLAFDSGRDIIQYNNMSKLSIKLFTRRTRRVREGMWKVKVLRGEQPAWIIAHTGNHESCVAYARRTNDECILERGGQ